MGVLAGYKQKQIYVEDGLWPLVNVLAEKLDVPIYKVVNIALKDTLSKHLTKQERKALKTILRSTRGESNGTSEHRGQDLGGRTRSTARQKARSTDR